MRFSTVSLIVLVSFFSCGVSVSTSSGSGSGSTKKQNGESCTSSTQCAGDQAWCADDWPSGGACTTLCDVASDCSSNAQCVTVTRASGKKLQPMCLVECSTYNSCKSGYECLNVSRGSGGVCIPKGF